jgi:hypothetical protein
MKSELSKTVSFRLTADDFRLLNQATVNGESAGDCARRLLLASLHEELLAAIHEELAEVKSELSSLRDKLATLAVAVLCDAGRVQKHDAEAFVAEVMGD